MLLFALLLACPRPAPVATPPPLVELHASDPEAARADLLGAVKAPGLGGLAAGTVVRLTVDQPVYRLWNGPAKVDANGHDNRLGQWWTFDAPQGTQEQYRVDYEICEGWNDLTWVATCTLKAGSIVVIGPGQSVSQATCGTDEVYAANPQDLQVYVAKAWTRLGTELDCPDASADYPADPNDLTRRLPWEP